MALKRCGGGEFSTKFVSDFKFRFSLKNGTFAEGSPSAGRLALADRIYTADELMSGAKFLELVSEREPLLFFLLDGILEILESGIPFDGPSGWVCFE